MGWFSKLFKKIFSWVVVIVAIAAIVIGIVLFCGAALAAMSGFLASGMAGVSSATFMGMSLGQCMLIANLCGFAATCLLQVASSIMGTTGVVTTMADASATETDTPEAAPYEPTVAGSFVKRLSITNDTVTEVEFVLREGDTDVVISSEVEDGFYAGWLSAQAVALAAQADLLIRTGQAETLAAELAAEASRLEETRATLAATITELQAASEDATEARGQLADTERQLAEVNDLMAQLRAANLAARAQLDAASDREQELKDSLSAAESDALSLGLALAAATDALANQEQANGDLARQLTELTDRNREYQESLAQLTADSRASQEKWAAAVQAQEALTTEAREAAAALAAQITALQAQIALTAESNQEELTALTSQLETTQQALATAEALRTSAERGLEYANSEIVSLKSLAESLTAQLDAADQSALVTELRSAIAEYDRLLTQARSDLRDKDEVSQQMLSRLSAATDRVAQLMASAELDQQAIALLESQVSAAALAAATYQSTLAQRDLENAALKEYVENLSKQLSRLSQVTDRHNKTTTEHKGGALAAVAVATLAVVATALDN